MTTLHIEHPISDYTTWRQAFDEFQALRERAGVLAVRVFRPEDDDRYVLLHLDFADAAQATSFLSILRGTIWSSPTASPALAGEPRTLVLASV
jgi:hypothetical protein